MQLLSQAEHKAAVSLLQEKCKRWVGQTVIARRERDGVDYPGEHTSLSNGQSQG